MTDSRGLIDLIDRHRRLDSTLREKSEHFLSDWNGAHPFVERYLGSDLLTLRPETLPTRYLYFDEETLILDAIRSFHLKLEGLQLSSANTLGGSGSSPILAAFGLWILQQQYKEVFYVPPLYYTLHYFLRLLSVRSRAVTGKQVFEEDSVLNLPDRTTILLLCDPVWYAGRRVPFDKILQIAEWQKRTRSLVFVDGSFQYMGWNEERVEQTSVLDPELTFRLVSPTKSLGIPFFRFAYLLHPSKFHEDLLFLYESMVGGASVSDIAFAKRSVAVIDSVKNNSDFREFLKSVFDQLVEKNLIETEIDPECGYFVFAVPKVHLPNQVTMDQEYFELRNYPGYARINLMVAHHLLGRQPACRELT